MTAETHKTTKKESNSLYLIDVFSLYDFISELRDFSTVEVIVAFQHPLW